MKHEQRRRRLDQLGRAEPALGDLETLDGNRVAPPREPLARRRVRPRPRRWPWLLALLLVLLVAAGWSQRESVRQWLPQTEFNALLLRADAALAAGNLDGQGGDSARELYQAARALRGDDSRPAAGLERVGAAALDAAGEALAAGDLDVAAARLDLARALLGGGEALERREAELSQARAQDEALEDLLDRAAAALDRGELAGADGAGTLYARARVADPGNAIARHGLDKVGSALAAHAREALRHGRLDDADAAIAQLRDWLPDSASLPPLRAALGEAQAAAAAQLQDLLAAADADLAAGRLTGSGEDNAAARYRAVLALDADSAPARAGLARVAAALVQRADAALETDDLEDARAALDAAAALDAQAPGLEDARAGLAAADDAARRPAPPSGADKARVLELVTRGDAAAEAGQLMLPPGNSAWDLYRSALAIDADNADAMAGLANLPGRARTLFDAAVRAGDAARARELLDSYAQLAPGSGAIDDMRARVERMR